MFMGSRALTQAKRVPIGYNVPVVLFQVASKPMVPVAIGDKIQKVRGFRMQGGLQCALSWIADRSGRQSWEAIRIIGRIYR
jgi:hypothetical protein